MSDMTTQREIDEIDMVILRALIEDARAKLKDSAKSAVYHPQQD